LLLAALLVFFTAAARARVIATYFNDDAPLAFLRIDYNSLYAACRIVRDDGGRYKSGLIMDLIWIY
jgi:hypothetical protein